VSAPVAAVVVLLLAVLMAVAVVRANTRSRRRIRASEPVAIDPDREAERLVQALAYGPTRTAATTHVGDVRIDARWRVDLTRENLGFWWVRVGSTASSAENLSGVYLFVRARLEDIAREQDAAQGLGGAA
jgi:hypothetical protein